MGIGQVIGFGLKLFGKESKVVLPQVLNLIPTAILNFLFLHATLRYNEMISAETIFKSLMDLNAFWDFLRTLVVYILFAVPVIILAGFISILLMCVYADIVRQSYRKKNIMLIEAFKNGLPRVFPLILTFILEFLIVILVFGGLISIFVVSSLVSSISQILSTVLGSLGVALGVIAILSFILFFYETSAIVVIEKKQGMEAIKRSYQVARRGTFSLLVILLIVGLVSFAVAGSFKDIRYIGIILNTVLGLFVGFWTSVIPGAFYFEYEKRGGTKGEREELY